MYSVTEVFETDEDFYPDSETNYSGSRDHGVYTLHDMIRFFEICRRRLASSDVLCFVIYTEHKIVGNVIVKAFSFDFASPGVYRENLDCYELYDLFSS